MTDVRWQRAEHLYHAALDREEGERVTFLRDACGGDDELLREVESLLACDGAAEGLLSSPPKLAPLLGDDAGLSLIDRQIGTYHVLGLLGAGGMGEVYRANDTRLNRDVAIKVLPASFAYDADRLLRFEQEARATSALSHPNILTVYDIGSHEGSPYIVAELLEGEELRRQWRLGKR